LGDFGVVFAIILAMPREFGEISIGEHTLSRETLPNGLRVVVLDRPETYRASLNLVVAAGNRYTDGAPAGTAQFLEHLFYHEEEKRVPRNQSEDDSETNADYVSFTATFPADRIEAEMERMERLVFGGIENLDGNRSIQQGIVRVERGVNHDKPWLMNMSLVRSMAWRDHALGKSMHGTPESIYRITPENLSDFYQSHFRPDRSILTVAGPVNVSHVTALASKVFGKGQAGEAGLFPGTEPPQFNPALRVRVEETGTNLSYITLAFSTGAYGESSPEHAGIEVLSNVLNERVYKSLVLENGWSYQPSAYAWLVADGGFLILQAETLPVNTEQTMAYLVSEAVRAPVSQKEAGDAISKELRYLEDKLRRSETAVRYLGEEELYRGVTRIDAVFARVTAVDTGKLNGLKEWVVAGENSLAVVSGPVHRGLVSRLNQALNQNLDFQG